MAITKKIHEWIADHFDSVQYPKENQEYFTFARQMPWEYRIALVVFGVVTLAVCSVLMLGVCIAFYGLLAA